MVAFLSGLCDREHHGGGNVGGYQFLSGLCDREQ